MTLRRYHARSFACNVLHMMDTYGSKAMTVLPEKVARCQVLNQWACLKTMVTHGININDRDI